MKKILFSLFLGLFGLISVVSQAQNSADDSQKQGTDEIILVKKSAPTEEQIKTRSLGQDISAFVNFDMGCIEMSFDVYIGTVTIYIIDSMGKAIHSYTCDTKIEWMVYLPIPVSKGLYQLKIVSSSNEYAGDFVL